MASGNDGDVEMVDMTEKQNPTKDTGVPNNFGKPAEFRPQEFNQKYTSGQSEPGQTEQGPNRTIENVKSPLASLIQRVSLIRTSKDNEDTPQPIQERFKDSASASLLAEKEKMVDDIESASVGSNNGETWTPNIPNCSTSVKSDKWNAPSIADQKDYTAEGAIPKTQPGQRPEKPWKDFYVIVRQSNGTNFDILENCNARDCELSPVKMQYCIQYHFTELLEIFKADLGKMMHNMKQVLPSHQCIQFDVRSVPTHKYIEEIIVCLQDTANKVNYFQRFPASKVFIADPETLLKEYISSGQIAVYREEEATYVVGMVEDSKKVTEKLKKVPVDESSTYDTKTVDLKMDTAQELLVLKIFGFKDRLNKVQPNVTLVMNEEKGLVSFHGKTSDIDSAVDEVGKFMKSLLRKDISLEPMVLKLIGLPSVRERLIELFRLQNLKVFWHVSSFNNRVTCYVLNEHEIELFQDMLRQNFVMMNYPIGRLSSKENDFSGSQLFISFVEKHLEIDLVSEVRGNNHCIVTVKDLGNELTLMETQFKRNDTIKIANVNTVTDDKELTFAQKRQKTFVEAFDEEVHIIQPEKSWELEKIKLLKKFNFSTEISTRIPSIKIEITDEEIRFVGVEMKAVKDEISLFMSRVNILSIDKIPKVVLQFLKTSAVAVENIESCLKRKGIQCHWYVSEACDCLNILSLDSQAVKNAEDQILETVKMLEYSNTDDLKEILNCQEIKVLMKKRKSQLQIDDLQCDDILVFGLKDAVEEFSLTYDKIMDKNKPVATKQKVKVTKKVKLGARKDVLEFFTKHRYDKWRGFLDEYQMESEIDSDDEVWLVGEERQIHAAVSEFWRKVKLIRSKWSCEVHYPTEVLTQIDANTIQLIENESMASISIQNDTNLVQQQQLGQWVDWQFKIHLVLVHGNIYEMAADVLVCPTNENFEPSTLAKEMLDKGGTIMKDDFSNNKKRKAVGKNIYVTSNTGNLPCTMAAYLVVPEYQHGMNMQSEVVKCIHELFSSVENAQLQSIVIPVKILDHIPETTFLHWFVSAFNGFHNQFNHLKHIYLCTQYSMKTEGLFEVLKSSLPKAIEYYDFDHMCDYLETQNIRSLKPPNITIKLVKGVLVDQNVDVIVNSCNRELELKKGAVSSTILKKGGQSILTECGRKWPDGINYGEAIATTAGNMNFKFICHGALPHWTPGAKLSSQLLAKLVFDCMIYADLQKCRSIAFPVFGTGNLEYPWDVVAKIMIDTINKYGRMNSSKTEIKEVRIVLYDQDTKSIEAFENRKKQTEEIKLVVEDPEPPPKFILEARCRSIRVQVIPLSDTRCHHCEAVVNFLNYGQALQIQKDNRESKLVTSGILTEKHADNNFWTVTVYSDEQPKIYKEAVAKALSFAADERIATLAFCLMLGKDTSLKLKDQATLIRDLVNGLQKNRYLQAVKIVVPEREKFEMMLSKTISKQEEESKTFFSKVSRVGEYVFNSNKLQWKCVSYSEIIESPRLIITALAENGSSMDNLKVKLEGVIEKVVRQGGQFMGMTIKQDVGKGKHRHWIRTHKTDTGHIKKIRLSEIVCKQLDNALKDKLPSTEVTDGDDAFMYHLDTYEYSVIGKIGIRGIFFKEDCSSDPQQQGNEKDEVKREKVINRQVSDGIIDEILGDISSKLLEKYKLQDIVKKVQHTFLDVEPLPVTSGVLTFKFKSLDLLEEINKFLQKTYQVTDSCIEKSNRQKTKEPPKRPPSLGSDATQHEVKVDMEREQFDKLMFFCRDTLKSAIYKGKQLFLKVSSKSECRKYEDLIKDEVDKINQLSQVDIKFEDDKKKTDIEKFIKGEFSSIFWKIDGKVIQLFGSNYQILQQAKHQVEIVSGSKQETKGRRNRKFADPVDSYTSQSKNDLDASRKEASGNPTNIPSESLSKSYSSLGGASISMAQTYATSEGIVVKVYVGNILKLDVECIVNAANESLSHGGGVAAVISMAAGYQFDQESDDYVRLHGTIPVGSCCSTSAGNLHYKKVIHTVGPRWASYKYDEKNQCAKDLRKSIVCCFEEAETFKLKSIALPSISAGIFGVPKEVCVAEYKNAVAEFSGNRKNGTCLREIHFIDKDFGLISLIQQEFTKTFQQSSQISSSTLPGEKPDFRRSMSSVSNDGKFQQGSGSRSNRFAQSVSSKIGVFVVKQKIKVIVKTGDITKCEADAIVCPQEELLLSRGHIAREVEKICGHEYTVDLGKLSVNKYGAKRMNTPRKCVWKYVIQAVPPRFTYEAENNPQMFEKNLKETILNILIATKYSRIKILAIPLMGIETGKTPVQKFADQFAIAVLKQVEDKDFTVEEIQVIVHDMKVVKKIADILETKELDGIKKVIKSGHRSHAGSSEEAIDVGDGGTGDVNGECCICMDKLDNPKTLACGHVFCTDCIEQQFTYKPSCPQCGQIHGVVTGTQPDGRMNVRTKKYSLPGYSGTNTIEIEYMIYSGTQGKEHPNPDRYFEGITRTAFLPETKKGKMVLKLLDIAFKRKLVFTIGISTTTGKTGVVTWNDIHHKTNPKPNTQFGYPDDTYLDRVLEELAAKGITEKDLKD